MKKLIFLITFLILSETLRAQFQVAQVLSESDSIELTVDLDKGISYSHTIKANQTIFSIAKFFRIKHTELLYHNNLNQQSILSPGQIIEIPINPTLLDYSSTQVENSIPVIYQVQAKETLFRIARIYFPQAIDDLVYRNQLQDISLAIDQKLIVAYYPLNGLEQVNIEIDTSEAIRLDTLENILSLDEDSSSFVRKTYGQRGIAIWNRSGSDKTNAFVLHRDAKINSYIEIYNPVVNRKTIAKVVGHIPEKLYSKDVMMVMSPRVAESLGALDTRLMVEMTYHL